eukprot:COSAG05_NODE_3141_length_2291_cov_1.541515_3_plen_37_part_01
MTKITKATNWRECGVWAYLPLQLVAKAGMMNRNWEVA